MEYVPGRTLAAVLENKGRLSSEETLRVADQTAAALGAAHDVGIIHRDVKPSNILIDDHGRVKVTDFGIAVAAGQGDLTDQGHLVGTARYMSPEHAHGEDLDGRSDLYSLGIVMYEMLTGAVPFDDEDSPLAVLEKHVSDAVPPMEGVPPMTAALVMKCLEKRRVDRPRTAMDFRKALREAASELDWQGPALPPLEPAEEGFAPDPSFRYDRAGVVRSITDTVTFALAERLRQGPALRGRIGRRLLERMARRLRLRRDSYKLKRLEVLELRENLVRAEAQLEEAKRDCDVAHAKYEDADAELHEWQMSGSLSLERGKKFTKEAAAVHEKKLWQQLTSYKLQWQNLQDSVRDWYANVDRTRRDYEAAVRDLELLRLRRDRVAEETGVARLNRIGLILVLALLVGAVGFGVLDWIVSRQTLRKTETPLVYGQFLPTGTMLVPRDEHAAALLDNESVLVAGGIDANHRALDSAEIYRRKAREFTATGSLCEARFNHTMTTLADGRGVLVVGGEQEYHDPDALASVEKFVKDRFEVVSRLNVARTRHQSVLLPDGRVLVTGGNDERSQALSSAEVFVPATNSFRTVGRMKTARKDHVATVLKDGRVVVTGGSRAKDQPLDGVEVYDPITERFEEVCRLREARYEHTATALDSRRILVIGGRRGQESSETLDSVELVDIERGTSEIVAHLWMPRKMHSAVLLPGTRPPTILIVGGAVGESGRRNACELFAPGWGETTLTDGLSYDRANHTATLMGDGSILFAGGYGQNTLQPLPMAELYVKVPASLKPLLAPKSGDNQTAAGRE
jgi:multidrug efflux pump subunit AcrA (membrane-fusion protein)